MILGPHALLGRSPFFKGRVRHLALNRTIKAIGGASPRVDVDRRAYASFDGKRYAPLLISGDLAKATTTANAEGAFQPLYIVPFKSKVYLFGTLWKSQNSLESACFSSIDLHRWTKETIPYATEGPSGPDSFRGVAANADYLAALNANGQFIWTDGVNWSGRNDLPLSGRRAGVLGASSGGFFVGAGGQPGSTAIVASATTPGGTWATRTNPFNTNGIIVAAAGDLALLFARYIPAGSAQQLISAPLNNLTAWSNVAFPASLDANIAAYAAGKWFAGASNVDTYVASWLTASAGGGPWTEAAAKPWGSLEVATVRGLYHDGVAWNAHYNNGLLARSENNGGSWDQMTKSGLFVSPDVSYIAAFVG